MIQFWWSIWGGYLSKGGTWCCFY